MSVIIASIQHTGTWKTIEVIETLFDDKVELIEDVNTLEIPKLMQTHIYAGGDGIHFMDENKHTAFELIKSWSKEHNVIVPLRDPVQSIATRRNRHPELSTDYIVEAFNRLPELKDKVFFLPVDLCQNKGNRIACLSALVSTSTSRLNKYIDSWEVVNSTELPRRDQEIDRSVFTPELRAFLKGFGYNMNWL